MRALFLAAALTGASVGLSALVRRGNRQLAQQLAGNKEALQNMPKFWWRKQAPLENKRCYRTKTDALNKFREWNQRVIDDWGGESAIGDRGEFDALTKWGSAPKTMAEALWVSLPPERVNYGRGPFCLDQIDVEALNDTAPGRDHPVGFQLPDFIHDERIRREEEEWYRRMAGAARVVGRLGRLRPAGARAR